jgi:hypothetical protein
LSEEERKNATNYYCILLISSSFSSSSKKPLGMDVKSVRASISVYNRRPTVIGINIHQINQNSVLQSHEDMEKRLIEQALQAKDTDQMEAFDEVRELKERKGVT